MIIWHIACHCTIWNSLANRCQLSVLSDFERDNFNFLSPKLNSMVLLSIWWLFFSKAWVDFHVSFSDFLLKYFCYVFTFLHSNRFMYDWPVLQTYNQTVNRLDTIIQIFIHPALSHQLFFLYIIMFHFYFFFYLTASK